MAAKLINGSGARIDVHAHAFTPEFTRVLRKSVSRPLAIRSIWEWDENRFLGEMDRWNVTLQVLSLPQMYEYFDWRNRKPAIEMSQVANDEYAQICAKHPVPARRQKKAARGHPHYARPRDGRRPGVQGARESKSFSRVLRYYPVHPYSRTSAG